MSNRFKQRIMWRDTMREPRLLIFDARVVFFILLLAVHLAVWTAVLLIAAALTFWGVERVGYRYPSALRAIRSTFAGAIRPAFYQRQYRTAVDYGFEYRQAELQTPIRDKAVKNVAISKEALHNAQVEAA